jgi:asparagine synthase (glutamine-hydrolysing)
VSGIVAVVNRDGAPVDVRLLRRLTDALKHAGPDAQDVWVDGAVGLGHAWLGTGRDASAGSQPLTLDGQTWITADARVDAREDLVRALSAHGREPAPEAPDAALILHAYGAWGEACVGKLLGDYAFAIWDGARRRLLCARDHFGVKPLYYAETPSSVIVSTSLDCVRRHPGVSAALDDAVIVSFLRDGATDDPAATAFRHVRRVPAAHCLVVGERVAVKRYWRLPVDGEVRYRRGVDYVERFTELLEHAIADRLRTREVGVLMSGGLDSTTVAATAKRCLSREPSPFTLRAYTTVCERVVPDPESRYATLAARALGIPLHVRVADDYQPFERWDKPELRRPEPEGDPLLAIHVDQLNDAATNGRVLLTGHGADPAMRLPASYAVDRLKRGELARLASEVGAYIAYRHRFPRLRLGRHLRRWLSRQTAPPVSPPAWLRATDGASHDARASMPAHPTRPHAYELLTSPDWPQLFETYDANVTGVPVDVRHPWFDRRVVEYLLAIPPMPWCFDKTIVRVAMRGVLPDAIRLRPKTVAAGDALVALLAAPGARWIDAFTPAPALDGYVRRARVPRVCGEQDATAVWTHLRPLCLDYWLRAHGDV